MNSLAQVENPEHMDHSYIEEHRIAERYVMGKLTANESARFEEHYLLCQRCLDELELAERFHRGLRGVVTEEAARADLAARLGILAWWSRLGRTHQAGALVAAVLVLAVLPFALSQLRDRPLGSDLERAQITIAELERQQAEGRDRQRDLESQLEARQEELNTERSRHEDELRRQHRQQQRLEERLNQQQEPRVNPAVLLLSPERSASGQEPTVQLSLPSEPQSVVLLLEWDGPDYPNYGGTLTGPGGVLWQGMGLERSSQWEALGLSLPSELLTRGDFLLRIHGLTESDQVVPLVSYSFRVLP